MKVNEEDHQRLELLDTLVDNIATTTTYKTSNKNNKINIPAELFDSDNYAKKIDVVISGGGLRGYYVTGAQLYCINI